MAVVTEMWMAARNNEAENSYKPLGYSTEESEVVALCTQENDFVCLYDSSETPLGTPLPGYWPMLGQTEPQ